MVRNLDSRVRSAGLALASLVMATGDPREATTIAHSAIDDAAHVRSQRANTYLRELGTLAAAHPTLDDVTHLRRRLARTAL